MAFEITYDGTTFTYPNLSLSAELPFGFDGSNVRRGRTAEMLKITGVLLKEDAETLIDLYRAWRDEKILEEDPEKTGELGAVVLVSGEDIGFSWEQKQCWFNKAPDITYAGIYAKTTIEVVDAEQALQIIVEEEEDKEEDGIDLGTLTLGDAVITLLVRPENYGDLPQLQRNPAGAHVISGSLTLEEVKDVEGWVTETDLPLLESWLNTTIATTPAPNTWFPTNWQRPTAKKRTVESAIQTTYDVKLQLVKIKG
jgi:hypothetical protein